MDNKYKLICLVIKRIRQLINEKERMGLVNFGEKFINIALREIREGKLSKNSFVEER